jgi:hypothetical protein
VVKVRAEAMQAASERAAGGMLSVLGRPQAQYRQACLQAQEHCRGLGLDRPVCNVATFLFPDGRVIAGHKQVGGARLGSAAPPTYEPPMNVATIESRAVTLVQNISKTKKPNTSTSISAHGDT